MGCVPGNFESYIQKNVSQPARGQKPRITFDTNIAGVWNTRVFWATLCEALGQTMKPTPTATVEVLRRIQIETEREWTKKLRVLNRDQSIGWGKVQVRRLAITAAAATRDRFETEMTKQGAIYEGSRTARAWRSRRQRRRSEDLIDDRAFDLSTENGLLDRKIVIEALARGYGTCQRRRRAGEAGDLGGIAPECRREGTLRPVARTVLCTLSLCRESVAVRTA